MGLKSCKWSRLNVSCIENHLSQSTAIFGESWFSPSNMKKREMPRSRVSSSGRPRRGQSSEGREGRCLTEGGGQNLPEFLETASDSERRHSLKPALKTGRFTSQRMCDGEGCKREHASGSSHCCSMMRSLSTSVHSVMWGV